MTPKVTPQLKLAQQLLDEVYPGQQTGLSMFEWIHRIAETSGPVPDSPGQSLKDLKSSQKIGEVVIDLPPPETPLSQVRYTHSAPCTHLHRSSPYDTLSPSRGSRTV